MKKNKTKVNLYRWIGNVSIALSILFFGVIFAPFFMSYFPRTVSAIDTTSSIYIPKIKAYAPVIYNVDPFDEGIYKKALTQGVAHAKGSAVPGQNGNVYLFAHSSGLPWEITRFNTIFLRLNELQKDDEIDIYREGVKHTYKVLDKKEVWPSEVSYLVNKSENEKTLILQTCSPVGTDLKRLLVFAKES